MDLPVEVIRSAKRKKTVSARVVNGTVQIRMPLGLSKEQEDGHVADLLQKLDRKAATREVDLSERAQQLADEYELPLPASVKWVSNQNTRWGSCTLPTNGSLGTIRLSDRMSNFPQYVVDFVLLHELTHLVEGGHNERFHELMARFPRAERAEGYLEAAQNF